MSPTSYQAAPPRDETCNLRLWLTKFKRFSARKRPLTERLSAVFPQLRSSHRSGTESPCPREPFQTPHGQFVPVSRCRFAPAEDIGQENPPGAGANPLPPSTDCCGTEARTGHACCTPRPAPRNRAQWRRASTRRCVSPLIQGRRSSRPDTRRPRPAAPRSAAAGCTWRHDPCGLLTRS